MIITVQMWRALQTQYIKRACSRLVVEVSLLFASWRQYFPKSIKIKCGVQNEVTLIYAKFSKDLFIIFKVIGLQTKCPRLAPFFWPTLVAWGKMDTGGKMTTPPFYGFWVPSSNFLSINSTIRHLLLFIVYFCRAGRVLFDITERSRFAATFL